MAYYDFIRVYGSDESPLECFQGLGAAALYGSPLAQPQSGENVTVKTGGGTVGGVTPLTPVMTSDLWEIQNYWIDAEIERLLKMITTLERAETLAPPVMDDATGRGLWEWIAGIPAWAAQMEPHVAMAIKILEVADAAITVGTFAYSIYQRFFVERETLRHLPQALIALCRMTIDLLRQIRAVPNTVENFSMRQQMTTDLTERFEQNLQFYITGQNDMVMPSTMAASMEQLTNALQELNIRDQEIDLGAVRLSARAQIITTS